MNTRTQQLFAQFEAANQAVIAAIKDYSPAEWAKIPTDEQRSIGVLAYHIAEGYPTIFGLAQLIAQGQPLPPLTFEMIHLGNAQQAVMYANADQAGALALLQRNGTLVGEQLRALTDEQLAQTAEIFGQTVTAEGFIEYTLIGHIHEHASSIKSVLRA